MYNSEWSISLDRISSEVGFHDPENRISLFFWSRIGLEEEARVDQILYLRKRLGGIKDLAHVSQQL